MRQVDIPVVGFDSLSRIPPTVSSRQGLRPVKESVDAEDRLLFEDMDEADASRPTSDATGSWLHFMEYGDGGVIAPTSGLSFTPEKTKEYTSTKVERIEQSFAPAPLKHKDKPELVAEAVWEVFPDEIGNCFDFGVVVSVWCSQ